MTTADFIAAKIARNEARSAHAEPGLTSKVRANRAKALEQAEGALTDARTELQHPPAPEPAPDPA